MSKPTVLLVEDEPSFVEAIEIGLHREGFNVKVATDGVEALDVFARIKPDIVLIDVMLPRMSGIDVCRQIRATSGVPIIMVTARTGEIDAIIGLEVGADDYVTKPYRLRELVARIRAQLRRATMDGPPIAMGSDVITIGNVSIDPEEHRVWFDREVVNLPLKEFDVLYLLMVNAGRVVTRGTFLDRIWGTDYVGDSKTLDVHVKRVRDKIDLDPEHPKISTIRGVGYRFERP